MSNVPNLTLNDGHPIPQFGLGVWQVPNRITAETVRTAFAAGYRSVDTAALYRNEQGVGEAIATADLPREELFITTKLWHADRGYDGAMRGFDESMGKLKLDYLDLYLIHWPPHSGSAYVDAWRAFEKLKAEGRVRSIGVSNFQVSHLRRLFDETGTVPAVNQIELHPNQPQERLRAFHAEHGILTESYSPLAVGRLVSDRTIGRIADKHDRTPAQIILRWHIQLGLRVIPKSVTPARIRENIDVFDFELAHDDLEALATLAGRG